MKLLCPLPGGQLRRLEAAEHFLGSGDEYYINSRLGDSDYRLSARIISLFLSLRRIQRVAVIIRGNETAKSAIWLSSHRTADPAVRGPFWLTTLAHAKDSLCRVDPFCAESITLRTHWTHIDDSPVHAQDFLLLLSTSMAPQSTGRLNPDAFGMDNVRLVCCLPW